MTTDVLPDAETPFGQRVRARLRDEQVIWMVTVGADGAPQPNPVWFLWNDSDEFMVYSRSDAHRLAHLRERPDDVTFHFDSDGRGSDIVVILGSVAIDEGHPAAQDWPDYMTKYGDGMVRVTGSAEKFSAAYPVPLRVRITGVRGY